MLNFYNLNQNKKVGLTKKDKDQLEINRLRRVVEMHEARIRSLQRGLYNSTYMNNDLLQQNGILRTYLRDHLKIDVPDYPHKLPKEVDLYQAEMEGNGGNDRD